MHVEDLVDLYIIFANKVVKNGMQGFPSGERGIYFAGTGRHTGGGGELARGIAKAMYEAGGVKTDEVRRVGLKEAAETWTGGDELACKLNFGSKYVICFPTSHLRDFCIQALVVLKVDEDTMARTIAV